MNGWPVWLRAVVGLAVAAGTAGGGYLLVLHWPEAQSAEAAPDQPTTVAEAERDAFWTCVMHPAVRQSGPGQCPICRMDLIRVKKGAGLTLTKRQKDLVPIRTEPAGYHRLAREIRTVGTLTYNERKLAAASTRVSGWIERLYVDFAGTLVRVYYTCPDHPGKRFDAPGQCPDCKRPLDRHADHLVEIYSPELLTGQEEYLQALQAVERLKQSDLEVLRTTAAATVTAAAAKLRLLGLTEGQIEEIRQRGRAVTTLTLYAPMGGTVTEVKFSTAVTVGYIALFGVAVEDGIVFIEFLLSRVRAGAKPEAAAVEAGVLRVRPILMTTATTVLALLPIMLYEVSTNTGAELMQPIAVPTFAGMLTCTLTNLIVTPVLFCVLYPLLDRPRRRRWR